MQSVSINQEEYNIPLNFNDFVDRNYKSMVKSIVYRVGCDMDRVKGIINTFILSMLREDDFGIPKYKKYDSEKYPNISYSKWFLSSLKFYSLKEFNKRMKEMNKVIYLEDIELLNLVSKNKKKSRGDVKFFNLPEDISCNNAEVYIFIDELCFFLKNFSDKFKDKRGYERDAYSIFSYKLLGFSNKDISNILKTSQSNISIYSKKLKDLITRFVTSGLCPIDYSASDLIRT